MQQIVDYKNDPGNSYTNTLLCFLQIFVVSNQTNTWYFANNHRRHFSFDADERFLPVYQFAGEDNKKIVHLREFTEQFLAKCTLSKMISHYMVLVASEQKLMMMRPYQIYAVQAIEESILQNRGNGYIWHTTGSGKTLTSFKTSTLLKENKDIEKCLFVVDRKDLDRQTREEFNKFQEGCVEENTNTATLVQRLLSNDYADKVIVTTIQKLGLALNVNHKSRKKSKIRQNFKERLKSLSNKRIVFIFDECHRSQFGENHKAIKEFFPNAQLFGFTGTPIFEANATYQQIEGQEASLKTTGDIFRKQLHAYTITPPLTTAMCCVSISTILRVRAKQNQRLATHYLSRRFWKPFLKNTMQPLRIKNLMPFSPQVQLITPLSIIDCSKKFRQSDKQKTTIFYL